MKYQENKIEFIFNKLTQSKIIINNIKGFTIKESSIKYYSNSIIIASEWLESTSAINSATFTLHLEKFPPASIPFIRTIALVKTLDGWIDKINNLPQNPGQLKIDGGDYLGSSLSRFRIIKTNSQDHKFQFRNHEIILNDYEISHRISVGGISIGEEDDLVPLYIKIIMVMPNVRFDYEIQTNNR